MNAPSERKLAAIERELRQLPVASQRAAGGGVYMRLQQDGLRRFQIRVRTGGQQPGRTFDTWQEAYDEHERLNGQPPPTRVSCDRRTPPHPRR